MDLRTKKRFCALWLAGVPLSVIAEKLRYSASSLSKLRMAFNLPKRFGNFADEEIPSRSVIAQRAEEVRQNWSVDEHRARKQCQPHTIYQHLTAYDDKRE